MTDKIETPRGVLVRVGKTSCRLTWNPGFAPQMNQRFESAQQFLDTAVLELSEPYMPYRTKMLIRSGTLGTVVGSGEVAWIAPYARKQYYDTASTRTYDAKRGGHWFARMKAAEGPALIASVRRQFGR